MKKKIVALLFVAILSGTLAACGNAYRGENAPVVFKDETIMTMKQFVSYGKKVEITMDNWQDYFENKVEPFHGAVKDEYGDETIIDTTYCNFGVKDKYDFVLYKKVLFKFGKVTEYCDGRGLYEVQDENGPMYGAYRVSQLVDQYTIKEEHYTASGEKVPHRDITNPRYPSFACVDSDSNGYYENCLSAEGEILVFDIPDELWSTKNEITIVNENGEHIEIICRGYRTTGNMLSLWDKYFK